MDNIPAAPDQQAATVVALPIWENVSGAVIRCRMEPDLEKKADMSIASGQAVAGVMEGGWLKTADGLYLPTVHPNTGARLFTPAQQSSAVGGGGTADQMEAGRSLPPREEDDLCLKFNVIQPLGFHFDDALVVTRVLPGLQAEALGVPVGYRVNSLDGCKVNPTEFENELKRLNANGAIQPIMHLGFVMVDGSTSGRATWQCCTFDSDESGQVGMWMFGAVLATVTPCFPFSPFISLYCLWLLLRGARPRKCGWWVDLLKPLLLLLFQVGVIVGIVLAIVLIDGTPARCHADCYDCGGPGTDWDDFGEKTCHRCECEDGTYVNR